MIYQLVNKQMKEDAYAIDHVNKFNSILSRLVLVNIEFVDEVQILFLLSSLSKNWLGIVIAISSSSGLLS